MHPLSLPICRMSDPQSTLTDLWLMDVFDHSKLLRFSLYNLLYMDIQETKDVTVCSLRDQLPLNMRRVIRWDGIGLQASSSAVFGDIAKRILALTCSVFSLASWWMPSLEEETKTSAWWVPHSLSCMPACLSCLSCLPTPRAYPPCLPHMPTPNAYPDMS